MTEEQRRPEQVDTNAARELHEGVTPTTNRPLGAEPRPRIAPAVLVGIILALVVVIFLALSLL